MRRFCSVVLAMVLVSWCLPVGAPELAADPSAVQSSSTGAAESSTQSLWADAKRALGRGEYRDALQAIEDILAVDPNDPWAVAYRSLCEKRLSDTSRFVRLSPEAAETLDESQRQEQRAQKQASVQANAFERQIKKEQDRWDAELKRYDQQTARARRIQKEQARLRQVAGAAPAPVSRPVVSTPPPMSPMRSSVASQPRRPGLVSSHPQFVPPPYDLSGVTLLDEPPSAPVPMHPLPPAAPDVAGEAHGTVPPGSVQLFADQLGSSPDRRLATATGHVRVLFDDGHLVADHAVFFTDTKDMYAEGGVYMVRSGQVFRGDLVQYNSKTKKGRVLNGTIGEGLWYQHGEVIENIAEGVVHTQSGYLTSCEFEPPHFRMQSGQATVFTNDRIMRGHDVMLAVADVPIIYLPWISLADRQTPFFLIPGKKKPWEQFVLMGYRYEWPSGHKGTLRWDWRRTFGWGFGLDDQIELPGFGKALFKAYYNEEPYSRAVNPKTSLPKGAAFQRYRVLWRHNWYPMPDTSVVTDIQEYSDELFRKDFLFREEYVSEDHPESYISMVTNDPNYTLSTLVRKRMGRYESVTEALPQVTVEARQQRIGDTQLFANSRLDVANLEAKRKNSDDDQDVVRVDWMQQFRYAMNLFRPILVTPSVGVRQTYHTKDIQSGTTDRPEGNRDVISGQFFGGADASLKLFRTFPVATNFLGLNIHQLRHVLTPTLLYEYYHPPTVQAEILAFPSSSEALNRVTLELENKFQTKRPDSYGKFSNVDIARLITKLPYTYRGHGNKQGGRLGDWLFDLEVYPWPWMRLESDLTVPSHFMPGSRDSRITSWNVDLAIVGGEGEIRASDIQEVQAPAFREFRQGPQQSQGIRPLPQGQWYLGLGHRYSQNSKTEDVLQADWRLSEKWQLSTFHRFTWKEVVGSDKRFNNLREYQYVLSRDLHDWLAELVYRVDREYGEEIYFTMTLKAFPELPIAMSESYHQPKVGSQNSPFSPIAKR